MRAAVIVDREIRLAERPDPEPGLGQVLVKVMAAGVNAADLLQRQGNYPAPPGSPADIPGLELAGVVVRTGPEAHRFEVGDRVMAVVGGGAQAELAVVHERLAMPVPEGVDWTTAGAFPETFTTAHDAMFTQCHLTIGERVLVQGAAGGVGTAAVQLAAAAGARVTGTVRRAEHRRAVADLGAEVIAPDQPDSPASRAASGAGSASRAASGADHGPFDVVLELVGGPNLATDLRLLSVGGRIAVIGVGAGSRAEVDLSALMSKRARICGSTLRARPLEGKADAARRMETHVLALLAAASLRVPVCATFALDDVAGAYDRFAAGGKLGKIVVVMTSP